MKTLPRLALAAALLAAASAASAQSWTDEAKATLRIVGLETDCEAFRLVIRNDGSGGERQVRRGEGWVSNKADYGLKPVP